MGLDTSSQLQAADLVAFSTTQPYLIWGTSTGLLDTSNNKTRHKNLMPIFYAITGQDIGKDQHKMLPAIILSPSNVRTFHEKLESERLIRNTSPL